MIEGLLLAWRIVGASSLSLAGWVGVELSHFRAAGRERPFSFIGPDCRFLAHIQSSPGFTAQLELGWQPDDGVAHLLEGLNQGWVGWRLRGWDIRVGLLEVPFGAQDESRNSLFSRLVTRPYELSEIVPLPWTDLGMAADGAIETPIGTMLFSFMASNGLVMGPTIRESRPVWGQPDNNSDKALTGRLGVTLPGGAQVGISGHFGARDLHNRKKLGMWGLDGAVRGKGFEVSGEYAAALIDTELGALRSIEVAAEYFTQQSSMPKAGVGGWAYGWHFMAGRWWGGKALTVTRFDRLRYVDYSRALDRAEDRLALGVNFYPQPLQVVKVEFDFFIDLTPIGFHCEVGVGF